MGGKNGITKIILNIFYLVICENESVVWPIHKKASNSAVWGRKYSAYGVSLKNTIGRKPICPLTLRAATHLKRLQRKWPECIPAIFVSILLCTIPYLFF